MGLESVGIVRQLQMEVQKHPERYLKVIDESESGGEAFEIALHVNNEAFYSLLQQMENSKNAVNKPEKRIVAEVRAVPSKWF